MNTNKPFQEKYYGMLNIMLKILQAEFQMNEKIFFPENTVKQLSAVNVINVCCGGVNEIEVLDKTLGSAK